MNVEAGRPRRASVLLWLLIAAYGVAHLLWYWQTPFGQTAVLDEKENLQLAEQIASGELPREPFYRAMVYPTTLAAFRALGVPAESMPQTATAFGLLLHFVCAALVARTAARWFRESKAGPVAAAVYGLNPVLLHHATQILDGTLANVFFLAGCALLPVRAEEQSWRHAVGFSLAWSAAALTRPQFLPLFLMAGPIWWLCTRRETQTGGARGAALACACLAGGALWLVQAGANARVSGHAWFLPWQGAYNLWAANKPGARGAYYTQTIALEENAQTGVHENPARWESLELYRRATGRDGLSEIPEFNAFWRARTWEHITSHPGQWLTLQARKAYYLLNDFEQYNNKTYAFHRRESPWLRFNPLGWGILFVGALGGAVALARIDPARTKAFSLAAIAIAGGIGLFYVSSRFRLPLVALLCIFSGGAAATWRMWRPNGARQWATIGLLAALFALLTFSRGWGAHDESTIVQDRLLHAQAANATGHDEIAWREAQTVLGVYPQRREVLRLAVLSYYNLLLADTAAPADEPRWRELAERLLATSRAPAREEPLLPIAALALWRSESPTTAVALWRENYQEAKNTESLAALRLAGVATAAELTELCARPGTGGSLSQLALLAQREENAARMAVRIFRRSDETR